MLFTDTRPEGAQHVHLALPRPSNKVSGCDNGGDLGKSFSSQRTGLYGQSPALIVIDAATPRPLSCSRTTRFSSRRYSMTCSWPWFHPPVDGDQQKSEWVEHSRRIVEHSRRSPDPLSRPPSRSKRK